jgi:hypothetical protein
MAELTIPLTVQSSINGIISGFVEIPGSQNANNLTIDAFFDFPSGTTVDANLPAFFHVRQADFTNANDRGYPDQFSTQLIQYLDHIGPQGEHRITLRIRLRRLDQDSGWSQSLRIDVLLQAWIV